MQKKGEKHKRIIYESAKKKILKNESYRKEKTYRVSIFLLNRELPVGETSLDEHIKEIK